MSKKLINKVECCVDESLEGFVSVHPRLLLYPEIRFITIAKKEKSHHVAILSGGGSGHEPFCAGYVGKGMLAGAVAGNVFASPPKGHILSAIRILNHFYKGGVLVIIPNYTGDRLNFGMAVEEAKQEGINVDTIIMGEDWASKDNGSFGGRGMCGLVFLYKIGGQMSVNGEPLPKIRNVLLNVTKNITTLGVSLRPCSLPGSSRFVDYKEDEIELGTGVHGEAGVEKIKMSSVQNIVAIILDRLCSFLNIPELDSNIVVMINNLGSTTQLEQNIVCNEVKKQLSEKNISVVRMYAGTIMTSLDMTGFQVCLSKVNNSAMQEILPLIDSETEAPCWMGSISSIPLLDNKLNYKIEYSTSPKRNNSHDLSFSKPQMEMFRDCLRKISEILIENELILNHLDAGCGDGDCGSTLKHLALGIQNLIQNFTISKPSEVFHQLSCVANEKMGGTSGALYSLFFTALEQYFSKDANKNLQTTWAEALTEGLNLLKKYGGAEVGDRTIIDVLEPTVITFRDNIVKGNSLEESINKCYEAALNGCNSTMRMKAKAGRASYVNDNHLQDKDAGAYGALCIIKAISEQMKNHK